MVRLVLPLVAASLLIAGCSKQSDAPTPPTSAASAPDVSKKRIANIDTLSLGDVKRYYDECLEFKDIGHPKVPYVAEDCRQIRARWDRRDMAKPSIAKDAPNLPTLK